MAYKKSIVCKNLEWKAGLASKKVFNFQSQLAVTEILKQVQNDKTMINNSKVLPFSNALYPHLESW